MHKCKRVYLFNLMHFQHHKKRKRLQRFRKNRLRTGETNENQSRRQKGIDRIKLIADGLRLNGKEKKAMQQTSQCQEWKAKSNQIANERERLTTKN